MDYKEFIKTKVKSVLDSGFNIETEELNSKLFDFQKFIVQKALKKGKYAIFADCGLGKGQPIGSKILTPKGWVNIENLTIDNKIIASDGKEYDIKGIYPKEELNTYRFYFSDGSSFVVDEDHLHIVRTYNDKARGKPFRVMSTKEILSTPIRYGSGNKSRVYDIPIVKPINFNKKELLINPYILGVIIGDGCITSNSVSISNPDIEILNKINSLLPTDMSISKSKGIEYSLIKGSGYKNPITLALRDYGLMGAKSNDKFIPQDYLFSSVEERLELLRGLMDTDGYIKDTSQYYTVSEQLKNDVVHLIRSLGGIPTVSLKKSPKFTYKNETKHGQDCYIITFSLKTFNPFSLPRKAKLWNQNPRDNGRWIDKIEFEKKQKTICISVNSPDKSYVTENFIVTHNTLMQLEFANQVVKNTKGKVLILAPLAVSGQTIKEGLKFDITVSKYKDQTESGVYITNYEQLDNIDSSVFSGVVLDESSILKNFTGAYKKLIIDTFFNTPYKLACTATPAPNDLNEIGNHSEFLNVMDSADMRMRWFVRDNVLNVYRLKGHSELDFYSWVSSWASVLRKPSDIGFESIGYDLPKLNYFEQKIITNKKDNGKLFNDESVNATEFNKELRITIVPRLDSAIDIINSSDECFLVWVNQNEEDDYLMKNLKDAKSVKGSEKIEIKESKLLGFANGEYKCLVTKKKIAQFGLNFQNCNNQVFASLDFSFESLYQAIRRSYRFGQKKEVNIYIITTDTMSNVIETIRRKEEQFNKMMDGIVNQVNQKEYKLSLDYVRREFKTEDYTLLNGDSVELIDELEDNSIDLSVFSPPFSNLFTYSDNLRDMGNCENNEEFFKQTDYLLKKLYNKIKNGRLVCIHTKDLAVYKNSSGYSGMYDFTGDYHRAMEKAGFKYHSKITIWIDPVLEMQRTKTQRLLYKQLTSDSSYSGIGMPEYITIFRKWEGNEEDWNPITNKTRSNFDLDTWQKWASPVWFDIKRTNVLNGYKGAKDNKDEKHICPLQLDVIERCVAMWSNKNETVFTPYAGVGSELYQSVKMGRKAIGIELKESYFDQAIKNMKLLEKEQSQMSLF